jgi:hypothetical protein
VERAVAIAVVGLGLLAGVAAQAAKERKIEGELCSLTHEQIVVMVKDAKVSAALTAETSYRKGRAHISWADLKISQRVVVTVVDSDGKAVATEVRVFVPAPPYEKK